jgi:hypothetical protein
LFDFDIALITYPDELPVTPTSPAFVGVPLTTLRLVAGCAMFALPASHFV